MERFKKQVERGTPEEQERLWKERDAYASSAYRLISKVCTQCHQIGAEPPTSKISTEGPPLILASDRLRPEWTERWIANPNRYLTYPSVMLTNFPNSERKFQDIFPGTQQEQLQAVRDVLMNYPRVLELPLNRYWPLLDVGEKK